MVTSVILLNVLLSVVALSGKSVAMDTHPSGRQTQPQDGSGLDPAPSDKYIPSRGIPVQVPRPQKRIAGIQAAAWGKICAQQPSLCRRPAPMYHRQNRPWHKPEAEKSSWS